MTTYSRPGVFIQEIELPSTITLADNGNAVGALVGTLRIPLSAMVSASGLLPDFDLSLST